MWALHAAGLPRRRRSCTARAARTRSLIVRDALGLGLGHHVLGARLLDAQDHVDPVQQRPAEPRAVTGRDRRVAAALTPRVALVSARTRIRRGGEQEPSRKADRALRPRDPHAALLERLAQRLERGPRELRQLVEEQHAVLREAGLPRRRRPATADETRRRRSSGAGRETAGAARAAPGRARRRRCGCASPPAPRRS